MRNRSLLCICLLVYFLGVSFVISPRQLNASLIGANFYEEITGLPFHPRVVDVDSKGNIFVLSDDQDVWRSTDNGVSWTKVFDDQKDWPSAPTVITRNWLTVFVDSQDNIFTNIFNGSAWNLYRSVDSGSSWSIVIANSGRSWHMDESSNGTLWYHTYSGPGWAAVLKSLDRGATWSVFYNFTMNSEDLRTVAVNDFNDNEVWMATSKRVMYWNGSVWINVHYDNRSQSYISSIWFDQKYAYLGAEFLGGRKANWRYQRAPRPTLTADWANYDYYWDADRLTYVSDEHSFHGLRINEVMLFGIRSQLWGSWDGTRWIKIVDLGNSTASDIASISQRRPVYFVDKKVGKLYHLSITKEDLVQLYYAEFLKYRGNRLNEENYVAEYRMANGTNEIDLTNVALNNVQASIKGLSRKNYLVNSGFETGNATAWSISGQGINTVVSTDQHEGTYSLKITKNQGDADHSYIAQNFLPVRRGDILILSAWIKSNITSTNRVILALRNQSGGFLKTSAFNVMVYWTRVKIWYSLNSPDVGIRAELWAVKGDAYDLFLDDLLLEKREVEILRNEQSPDLASIEHLQYQPLAYFADTLDTLNPTVTINGHSVSQSGILPNGTSSLATSLTGIFTGVVEVDANIGGSGQAILHIAGIRMLYEDSIVLKARKDGVYYGRYYGTFVLDTTTNDIVALTNLQSDITTLTYAFNKLMLTIDSVVGATIILVYVGDRGEPAKVAGATSWTYNVTTRTVTIDMFQVNQVWLYWTEHNPPTTTIDLNGVKGSNGWYRSQVRVNLTAADDISGVNQTEYSFDNNIWVAYTWPLTVDAEGTTVVYYKSTDNDGNSEMTKSETIRIDKTTPSGSVTINGDETCTNSFYSTLAVSADDTVSGVAQMRFSNDNETWSNWETYSSSRAWMLSSGEGTKTVYVQFMDNAGLYSTCEDTIILDTTNPTSNAGEDQTTNEDTLVIFNGSASSDDVGIVSYRWLFTDGTSQTLNGGTPTYTFKTPGVYTVILNVTDGAGNYATSKVVVTVLDITKPEANAGRDRTVIAGENTIFVGSNSFDNVGIISYEWNFGDGTKGTGVSTTHVYTNPGVYTVTLTVKDAANNTANQSVTIKVLDNAAKKTDEQNPLLWVLIAVIIIGIGTATTPIVKKKMK